MYAVIAEDKSDVETLVTLIRSIAGDSSIPVKGKGYSGCAEMLRKGANQMRAFGNTGECSRFVVCYDSDRADPEVRKQELIDRVITPSGVDAVICALVPIQEIEAWILADIGSVTNIIKGWAPKNVIGNPENIDDPKEYLERLSREHQKPRYSHATHNPRIAKYLDIQTVYDKCQSFRPLYSIVRDGQGNV